METTIGSTDRQGFRPMMSLDGQVQLVKVAETLVFARAIVKSLVRKASDRHLLPAVSHKRTRSRIVVEVARASKKHAL